MNHIIYDFSKLDLKKDSIVTIGKFDSVHKGHQKLIKYTVEYAKKHNLISIAIVIKKKNLSIYNTEENNSFIKALGINYIIVIDKAVIGHYNISVTSVKGVFAPIF